MAEESLIDAVEAAIRQAASGQTVIQIRLSVGKEVSISKVNIAKEMHRRFPSASVELTESKESDSIVVRDIEVE